MKILVLGHGQHGKDTLCEMIRKHYGLTFQSSSRACLTAIFPALQEEMEPCCKFVNEEHAYANRSHHRPLWKRLIGEYNTPDKSRLAQTILEKSNIYNGLRALDEFKASRHLFDCVIAIYNPNKPLEDSMEIDIFQNADYLILNNSTLQVLEDRVVNQLKFLKTHGKTFRRFAGK